LLCVSQAGILATKVENFAHTQIRVTHDLAQAIWRQSTNEILTSLILMGWKGKTITPGRFFGSRHPDSAGNPSC